MLRLLLFMSCVSAMDPEIVDLLTPVEQIGERCGYDSCPRGKEGQLNVHIVPHSHAELGHSRNFHQHYTGEDSMYIPMKVNMKRILDSTVSELWADRHRKFTLSDSELPYLFHWWSKREGTVRRMVYELIRQGRLMIVGGGWGMHDEATTSYQAIIDSYTYSMRKINATFLSCGRPLVAWQADVYGHSREYAALVAQMGFDGLFINPLSYDDEILRMQRKALEFVWRGSDDLGAETDVYTHKLFDGYWSPPGFCFGGLCSDPLIITSDSVFNNVEERVNTFLDGIRSRQAPNYNTKHVMVLMGQRFGYFTAKMWFENIDKLINKVNEKTSRDGDDIYLMYSTPACYLKSVHHENPVLETKQDDFMPFAYDKNSYITGTYTARPGFKYLIRQANVYLQIAKQLQVLWKLGNNDKLLESFMWIVGVVQDHNIITGAMKNNAIPYYTEKIHKAVERSVALVEEALRTQGYPASTRYFRCSLNESTCPYAELDDFFITVYNPVAWVVRLPIRLPVPKHHYNVYAPNGEKIISCLLPLPEHVVRISDGQAHELVFLAEIPALGYKSYYIEKKARLIRSIIKKIYRNNKKYITRQAIGNNTFKEDNEYENFDEISKMTVENAIEKAGDELENTETTENVEATQNTETDEPTEIYTGNMIATEENYIKNYYNTTTMTLISDTKEDATEKQGTAKASKKEESRRKDTTSYEESKDTFIKNQYIQINLDEFRKVTNIQLSNGINTTLDIQYYYYVSDEPDLMDVNFRKSPGVYIFRPIEVNPVAVMSFIDTKVYKNAVVEEIQSKYSDYASFTLKLYKDSPVVELDWVIGPVPAQDRLGKEVFIRYMTNLENDGVFYTDSNGRQTIKRIRNMRPMYEPFNLDPVAGNFYPVTSKIYIEDLNKNTRLSIFNERPQGGTSLFEGAIDVMLQRRIFTDDAGFFSYLNGSDTEIIRGTHYLYLTKANYKPNKIFEKKLAKEIELRPQIFIANDKNMPLENWMKLKNEYSALKTKLPIGIHLLTVQEWNDKTILMRLENYLEKNDVIIKGIKRVNVKNIFVNIKIKKIKETTLAANFLKNEWMPLKWRTKEKFISNFNKFYGSNNTAILLEDEWIFNENIESNEEIILRPQKIVTFIVWFEYQNNLARNKTLL